MHTLWVLGAAPSPSPHPLHGLHVGAEGRQLTQASCLSWSRAPWKSTWAQSPWWLPPSWAAHPETATGWSSWGGSAGRGSRALLHWAALPRSGLISTTCGGSRQCAASSVSGPPTHGEPLCPRLSLRRESCSMPLSPAQVRQAGGAVPHCRSHPQRGPGPEGLSLTSQAATEAPGKPCPLLPGPLASSHCCLGRGVQWAQGVCLLRKLGLDGQGFIVFLPHSALPPPYDPPQRPTMHI